MTDEIPYSNDRVKLYILVGVAFIFVLFGYFRFFYSKPEKPMHDGKHAVIPHVQPDTEEPVFPRFDEPPAETFRHSILDIFKPAINGNLLTGKGNENGHPGLLTFQGSVTGSYSPLAIINNTFVRQGEWIKGYQVISISGKTVELTTGEQTIILEMKTNE